MIIDNIKYFFRETLPDQIDLRNPYIYRCTICDCLVSPYLSDNKLREDYGWIEIKNHKGYICHNCHCHGYLVSDDESTRQIQKDIIKSSARMVKSQYKKFLAENNLQGLVKLREQICGYKIVNIPLKVKIKMLFRRTNKL